MRTTNHRFLLNASYRSWKDSHDIYVDLAVQLAAGANVSKRDVDAAREVADRALSDFMSIEGQARTDTVDHTQPPGGAHVVRITDASSAR